MKKRLIISITILAMVFNFTVLCSKNIIDKAENDGIIEWDNLDEQQKV